MSSIKPISRTAQPASVLLLLIFIAAAPFPLMGSPGLDWNGTHFKIPQDFVYRDSPAVDSFEGLDSTAREIEGRVEKWNENGHKMARMISDFHAVFPFPVEQIIPVFTDHENEDKVYPRIDKSSDLSPDLHPNEPHFQEIEISFKFLGFGEEYHYILYRIPRWYEDGSFLIHWALVHSIDEKYFELFGSWYLQEFQRDGKPHTYLRNFIQTGLIDPPKMLKTFTNLFARNDVRGFFDAVHEAAEKNVLTQY
ncbi:MAG: hypothetical protein ACP5IA_04920 [Sediminispirochaetaceae bacterium]